MNWLALTFLKDRITGYFRRHPTMVTVILIILYSGLLIGGGWYVGRLQAKQDCEIAAMEEHITALEASTQTYLALINLERRHSTEMADVEQQLVNMERSLNNTIDHILKSNPDVARWYHEDINVLQRAVMYGDAERMRENTVSDQHKNTH